jgi:hypothetical protein
LKNLDQPAFPSIDDVRRTDAKDYYSGASGLTKKEHFLLQVLPPLIVANCSKKSINEICDEAINCVNFIFERLDSE